MMDVVGTGDWAATSLGPQADWPQALRLAVEMTGAAQAPIALLAGPDLVAIYNAAFAAMLGDRHPRAFGQPAAAGLAGLWDDLAPRVMQVRETGQAAAIKDHPVAIARHGVSGEARLDISLSPVRDGAGAVCAVLCILSEITGRLRTADALARSEEQLRALLSQAHVGIVVANPDRTIRTVNTHFTAMTGYAEGDLRGRAICDIMVSPDADPAAADPCPDPSGQTADGREEQLRCKDGRLIWVARADGPIFDATGQIDQIGMIFSDVTARRAQEADMRRLAAIIASSDDAILGTDLDMRITSWNEGATRLYGYDVAEVIGQSVLMLVPPDRQWEEQRILARIRTGGRVQSHETIRRHRDGRMIDVSLTVSPIFDERGAVVGASKIARNISDRRVAEKMQRVLVDEMKHRVKNILATVHAIARQTFGHLRTPESDAFEARLFALSRAQDLITRETVDGVSLEHLIRDVLAPYPAARISLRGPAVALTGRAALSLTLGFHELATNAAKYGGLSTPQGRVAIAWEIDTATPPVFTLRWVESGGPPVTPPARRGFGTSLVRMVVPAELGGQAALDYAPTGLVWEVTAPVGAWAHQPEPPAARLPGLFDDEAG